MFSFGSVVVELARSRLTDESIATIAREIAAIYKQDRESGDYKRFEKLLSENKKQCENLMDALKYGKATEMIAAELDKLGAAREELERQLMLEKVRRVDIGEEEITFFLQKLRGGDFNDMNHRRILITVFINAIYLYEYSICQGIFSIFLILFIKHSAYCPSTVCAVLNKRLIVLIYKSGTYFGQVSSLLSFIRPVATCQGFLISTIEKIRFNLNNN